MIIYKNYNQQQLDDQYNNRLHVTDFASYLERWDNTSSATSKKFTFLKDQRYGDLPRETIDVFPAGNDSAKLLVFIHGGYWQMFDKTRFHFIADALLLHNVTTVFVNYPLAPDASMDSIVSSCRRAFLWVQQNIQNATAEPMKLYVAGHSAGAHLAAMLIEKEWALENKILVSGMCLLSGLYDLLPLQLCYVNKALQMNVEMAMRNSPVGYSPVENCPILLAVGAAETEEFKAQSSQLYQNWKMAAESINYLELQGKNHFSVLDCLVEENNALYKALRKLMYL